MYQIQANPSGTRKIDVTEEHLQTLKKYQLLRDLVDSNGIITDDVVDKLRFNVRALLESSAEDKALLRLCLDVVYHPNMKAFALHQLVLCYVNWLPTAASEENEL